jgi:hypothetical protein
VLLQFRLELVLVRLLRVHAVRFGHDQLDVAVLVRRELSVARDHARHAGELQALDEAGPIAVEGGLRPRRGALRAGSGDAALARELARTLGLARAAGTSLRLRGRLRGGPLLPLRMRTRSCAAASW